MKPEPLNKNEKIRDGVKKAWQEGKFTKCRNDKIRDRLTGRKQTQTVKDKISESMIGNKNMEGKELENHNSWKGENVTLIQYHQRARRIMAKYLGRKLTMDEIVHHIDCNPKNNNIQNLKLFPCQSVHRYWHMFLNKKKKQVEWLKKRVHVENGIAVVDWDYVKEAFEDVIKK